MLNNSEPNLKKITLLGDKVKNWDLYPFCVPAIKNIKEINIHKKICFFVGENGTGKSTLIEAIAENCGFGKEGGNRNILYQTTLGQSYEPSSLANYLRLSWTKKILNGYFLRAESFFNIATYLDSLNNGEKSLHKQSHGESFLYMFQNKFSNRGFYLLDEPEAALSPQRQLSLLVLLYDVIKHYKEVQFIISTHSPILLAFPDAQILSFDSSSIEDVKYQDTPPYQIMSNFLTNPDSYLKHLFED